MAKILGPCYPTSEAFYHLLGGKKAGWKPMRMNNNGTSHWFLKHKSGLILDPTVDQFKKVPNYDKGIGNGFLTKLPSKRAFKIIQDLLGHGQDT